MRAHSFSSSVSFKIIHIWNRIYPRRSYWLETVQPSQEQVFPASSYKNNKDFVGGNARQITFMGYEALTR